MPLVKIKEYQRNSVCDKCGYGHLLNDPTVKYDKEHNVLIRGCLLCGYTWTEKCKDGTDPIFEEQSGSQE